MPTIPRPTNPQPSAQHSPSRSADPLASRDASIVAGVTEWFRREARPLPWRPTDPNADRDPWHALVSEIMAQQTQIARVAERFGPLIERFPTPTAMAEADEAEVLALWSGLGYYRRARNLHAAARAIVECFGGRTPTTAAELETLPGVGRYTAGAVASIAAHQPTPIVDGNVARVLVRLESRAMRHGASDTLRWGWNRADDLARIAGDANIAAFNEGLMELGATVCTPGEPACDRCPLCGPCHARAEGRQGEIPLPKVRAARSRLFATAAVVTDGRGRLLLERRPSSGLWANLWQAPTLEADGRTPTKARLSSHLGAELELTRSGVLLVQTTHREVRFSVHHAEARAPATARLAVGGRRWVAPADLRTLGLGSAQRKVIGLALPSS
ncbi:MAG: A/G-specific adenine glycosylase [Planctomycetota bacterium]